MLKNDSVERDLQSPSHECSIDPGRYQAAAALLYAGCPDNRSVLVLLDLERLVQDRGVDFDILGTRLEDTLKCPGDHYSHRPKIGVGETDHLVLGKPDRGVGPNGMDGMTPFDEAVQHALELRRVARETNPLEKARHEQLQIELAKIRERKARRRARNPYDFS
ncbi:MAG TPA: hypothetical protein VGV07_18060 [Devosia sp.]|jgi:hypothetical protein|uniref:hypothetical protein n=1 Tax=Devosia sp. TaxID=1871048 RepID=UPI002DDD5F59|nr:hypothetical protein [Devosia sp.]HEV2517164.1 hypothetical protein [Devosia sp.]